MSDERWTQDERVQAILTYVRQLRDSLGIRATPGEKPEFSCEMFGEFRNLLHRQLLLTQEFGGGWLALSKEGNEVDEEVVAGVLGAIADERWRRRPHVDAELPALEQAVERRNHVVAVIPAAGMGRRMKEAFPGVPKALLPVRGRPMLSWVVDAVLESGVVAAVVVVVSPSTSEQVSAALPGRNVTFALQLAPRGTGDAIRSARPSVHSDCTAVLVLFADQPLISPESIRRVVLAHRSRESPLTMATVSLPDYDAWRSHYRDWGRVLRSAHGSIKRVVEVRDATPDELSVTEVNPSIYCFDAPWLWEHLELLQPRNSQSEFYLTDLVEMAAEERFEIRGTDLKDAREALGANDPKQLRALDFVLSTLGREVLP